MAEPDTRPVISRNPTLGQVESLNHKKEQQKQQRNEDNFVGFCEDNMHLLKRRIDNLVTNMCMHENDDNDDGHNCNQQNGT